MRRSQKKLWGLWAWFVIALIGVFLIKTISLAQTPTDEPFNRIQQLIESGNLVRASDLLEQAALKMPESGQAHVEAIQANIALRQGNYDRAIATYQKLYANGSLPSNRLSLLNNYVRSLLSREELYRNLAEDDSGSRERFLAQAQAERQLAVKLAGEAVELSGNPKAEIQAQIQLAKLIPNRVNLSEVKVRIDGLALSPTRIAKRLELSELSSEPLVLLQQSVEEAEILKDSRALSWAWGALAQYYENNSLSPQALAASERAAWAAQEALDWTKLAQWQWLSAKLYRQLKQSDLALASYRGAVSSIRELREMLAGSSVGQSLYLEVIEPILRDFLAFLLDQAESKPDNLSEAIAVLRLRQLAELDNYFGDICRVEANTEVTPEAKVATIYPVLLPDRSYEIVEFSPKTYQLVKLSLSEERLKQQILAWRMDLMNPFYKYYLSGSRRLYDVLIRPMEEELRSRQIKHLVFVQDGLLRTVPMSALFDSRQEMYLVEKVAISYSLGLGGQLATSLPQGALIAASSQPSQAFPNPLPGVISESQSLQNLIGGTLLLNENFSRESVAQQLERNNYSLLHIASHSRFTGFSDNALIQFGTDIITLPQFEQLLRPHADSLIHLTLSACETAEGSRYALLGLAGMGVRLGIPSVLGSLWFAGDRDTNTLVINFYKSWRETGSPAQALKNSQIQQIKDKKSVLNWSNFIVLTS